MSKNKERTHSDKRLRAVDWSLSMMQQLLWSLERWLEWVTMTLLWWLLLLTETMPTMIKIMENFGVGNHYCCKMMDLSSRCWYFRTRLLGQKFLREMQWRKNKEGKKFQFQYHSLSLLQVVKRVKNTCALLFNGLGDTMSSYISSLREERKNKTSNLSSLDWVIFLSTMMIPGWCRWWLWHLSIVMIVCQHPKWRWERESHFLTCHLMFIVHNHLSLSFQAKRNDI